MTVPLKLVVGAYDTRECSSGRNRVRGRVRKWLDLKDLTGLEGTSPLGQRREGVEVILPRPAKRHLCSFKVDDILNIVDKGVIKLSGLNLRRCESEGGVSCRQLQVGLVR